MKQKNENMNGKIVLGITIAFVISFTILFSMNFISQDPRTTEDIGTNPFFSSELDPKKTSIFLIGHSHVGQLNTIQINNIISQKYDDFDVYNLAMYHDTPSSRLEQIENLIDLKPKIIFYGIAIADFLGPCKYSNDCHITEKTIQKLPDPNDFLEDLNLSKKIGVEQMNPKFTTLNFIREGLSDNSLFSEQGRRLELNNTPFYVIDDTYTRITSDSALKNLVPVSSGNMIMENSIKDSNEIEYLVEIIEKFQKNNIKIVLFKTPHHKYYIENISSKSIRDFDFVLAVISDEMDIKVYDFFDNYADLPIWNDLEHIAYNEKSIIYTEDVAQMIIEEIEE